MEWWRGCRTWQSAADFDVLVVFGVKDGHPTGDVRAVRSSVLLDLGYLGLGAKAGVNQRVPLQCVQWQQALAPRGGWVPVCRRLT